MLKYLLPGLDDGPITRRLLRALLGRHYVTNPTSIYNRLTGQESFADGLLLGDATVLGAALVNVAAATTTLTLTPAAHGGRLVLVQSTGGLAITPPAATGTGITYRIGVAATIAGGNLTIDAKAGNASDVFYGVAFQNKPGTGLTTTPTASNTNLLTLNGGTTGGLKGDLITLVDLATNVWSLTILGQYSGTFATPFSNH